MMTFESKTTICKNNLLATTRVSDGQGATTLDGHGVCEFKISQNESALILQFMNTDSALLPTLCALDGVFGKFKEINSLLLNSVPHCLLPFFDGSAALLSVSREEFFQLPFIWHDSNNLSLKPEMWTKTKEITHPIRPRIQAGQALYRRHIGNLNKSISFRVADPEADLVKFHNWHNQDRVANFWELQKPADELKTYLENGLQDPHQYPVIVEFDNVPVGYFEMYWAHEDRLGPYYDSEAYDRGFHFLIGETAYLGFQNTDAVLKSVCHYLFLDDPRTRRIMAEPRYDNIGVLKYVETFKAWRKVKEFDFPHKRSALLECRRELLFGGNYL